MRAPRPLSWTETLPGEATGASPGARAAAAIAAVDLGSNSFHMSVAQIAGGVPQVVDRLRSRVALGAGLDEKRRLIPETCERALACLERFGQRLREVPPENVRAVGTSAMRQARDAEEFLASAERTLGHRIEIISGHEEARLTYLGVAHDLADDRGRRLLVDIGGGSTECIVGEAFEPLRTDSLHMGCIPMSREHFGDGKLGAKAFERAEIAARLELRSIERLYRTLGWQDCVGSSGTILAIGAILRENGWSHGDVTHKGLRKLKKALIAAGDVRRLELRGLQEERRAVLPGGLAILSAFFAALGIRAMKTSTGALRDGLLYDILGRIRHEDVRDRTVRGLALRYHVDAEQARRVGRTALALFDAVAEAWKLERTEDRLFLGWAAALHEIGLSIAYSGHHAHGAYIVQHTDMPGFSREEQHRLAALILSHRRKLSRERIATLVSAGEERCLRLAVLLRAAALLNRSRALDRTPPLVVEAGKGALALRFEARWLEESPLTRADLEQERAQLAAVGIALSVHSEDGALPPG